LVEFSLVAMTEEDGMKPALLALLMVLATSIAVAMDDAGRIVGGVEAVYHEGLITFTVNHPDAVSASVRVYDLETDSLIFDSGPRARTRVTWPPGHDFAGGFRYLVTAWNAEGGVVVSQTAANKRQTPISDITFDTIPDNTSVVGPGEIDLLGDVNIGTVPGVGLYRDYGDLGYGGGVVVYGDSTFDKRVYMSADSAAGAGYFRLNGSVGGFWIDGSQHLHGNEPAMSFYGGTSEFQFYAGETGTDSVVMPANAVSATEIENEPGVASNHGTGEVLLYTTGQWSVVNQGIVAPTDGYVFATAFVTTGLYHTTGYYSTCTCSLSETLNTHYDEGFATATIPLNAPSGSYIFPISLSRIIPVSAGSNQINLVCSAGSDSDIRLTHRHLDLLFVPTAYGSVSTKTTESISSGKWEPLTQADADTETAEAIAFNLARIQTELDAIQARADALAAEIDE
jgi:hypothetical protein